MNSKEGSGCFFLEAVICLLVFCASAADAAGPTYVGGTYSSN